MLSYAQIEKCTKSNFKLDKSGGGLAVPKDQPRGRSWEGTTGRASWFRVLGLAVQGSGMYRGLDFKDLKVHDFRVWGFGCSKVRDLGFRVLSFRVIACMGFRVTWVWGGGVAGLYLESGFRSCGVLALLGGVSVFWVQNPSLKPETCRNPGP